MHLPGAELLAHRARESGQRLTVSQLKYLATFSIGIFSLKSFFKFTYGLMDFTLLPIIWLNNNFSENY